MWRQWSLWDRCSPYDSKWGKSKFRLVVPLLARKARHGAMNRFRVVESVESAGSVESCGICRACAFCGIFGVGGVFGVCGICGVCGMCGICGACVICGICRVFGVCELCRVCGMCGRRLWGPTPPSLSPRRPKGKRGDGPTPPPLRVGEFFRSRQSALLRRLSSRVPQAHVTLHWCDIYQRRRRATPNSAGAQT